MSEILEQLTTDGRPAPKYPGRRGVILKYG